MRRVFAVAAAFGALSCGEGDGPRIVAPADRSFVRGGAPIPVVVESRATELAVSVDGVPIAVLGPDLANGEGFRTGVVPLTPGEHVITVYEPDTPGVTASARVYVDRLALAPVDGWGFSQDASRVIALSKRRTAADGLNTGVLEVMSVSTGGGTAVRLTEDGAFAEISGTRVAWVEGWGEGAGTLRLGDLGEPESAAAWPDVREMRFAGDGRLFARDEGLVVFEEGAEEPVRIAAASDAFALAGPLQEVVSFAAVTGSAYRVTFADATGTVTALATTVRPSIARNAARREVALFETELPGSLLVWDFATGTLVEGAPRAGGAEFSRDGSWLAAIVSVGSSGGTLVLSRRAPAAAAFETIAGTFTAAAFDAASEHLYARAADGTLVDVALGDPLQVTAIAGGVLDFAPLAGGAVVWYDASALLHLRRQDGAIVPVGALHPTRAEVVIASDGRRFAFPSDTGAREPILVADVVTGAVDEYGEDASRPTFLGEALAWLEERADAESGGLANHDLWLFPEFPASVFGATRVAERVMGEEPLAKSFAEDRLAVLADLPRRGTAWNARAVCVRADGSTRALGAADALLRFVFFLPDGRIARFGPDGGEERVLFLDRCE